eukprot:gnl/MRDRNA2_/MRDRNA2_121937_c0_seq1.p1 gnl/MRDRNA2_/MRDRNA2_121937_c0~~gnl/MRDRNA2_/MRDRNA2_121937_c0_seq1.p1  ORF type:complete len:483 (+),score=44.73 gnl/MRDRNA2_/MRDRNA2_121937_c0_seq1:202-1449(+)
MFYHEVEDDVAVKKKRAHVMMQVGFMLVLILCAVVISYTFLAKANIPVRQYECSHWLDANDDTPHHALGKFTCGKAHGTQATDASLNIRVSFPIYLIAMLCFIGWFFFVLFGGIGLSALPLDLIIGFLDRPRAIDAQTWAQRKRMLGEAATNMLNEAENLKKRDLDLGSQSGWSAGRQKRALKNDYNKWKRDCYMIESEYDKLEIAKYHQGENPVVSFTKLFFGIIFAILSICWIIHIIIYIVFRPLTPSGYPTSIFLNEIFIACENAGLYVLSVAFFAVFNLYLLVCTVKGCLKFGMRIFFFFAIHPMRAKETPLNSILFNVILVLLTCGAVVQFSQECFADYVRLTDADLIFSVQIKYLMFYRFFFENDIFIYTLLGWFLLTLIYLLVRPREVKVVKFDKKTDARVKRIGGLT